MMGNNISVCINKSYFWKLIPTTDTSEDCISNSHNSNEASKNDKNSKDQDTFSVLR